MKKIISAILAATVLSCNAYAAGFTDIIGHWAEKDINALANRGIVNGISDTVFDTDGSVTRVQFLKMVMEAIGMEQAQYRAGECLDALETDWYAPYLQSVLNKGLIPDEMIRDCRTDVLVERDGDGNALSSRVVYSGAFDGNNPITREEAAYLVMSLYQYTLNPNTMSKLNTTDMTVFTDVTEISEWAFPSVNLAAMGGIITGMDTGSFRPKDTATRAQAAVIINRLVNLMEG